MEQAEKIPSTFILTTIVLILHSSIKEEKLKIILTEMCEELYLNKDSDRFYTKQNYNVYRCFVELKQLTWIGSVKTLLEDS